jgi:hypothetical protein
MTGEENASYRVFSQGVGSFSDVLQSAYKGGEYNLILKGSLNTPWSLHCRGRIANRSRMCQAEKSISHG